MSDIVLSVDVRENTGTGPARAARRDGFVPGVLYGGKQGSVAIASSLIRSRTSRSTSTCSALTTIR